MYRLIMNASNELKIFSILLVIALVSVGCDKGNQDNTSTSSAPPVAVVDNASANIKFTANAVQASTGSDVVLTVAMQDLPATEGGGIALDYDAAMVSVSEVRINQRIWNFSDKPGVIDNLTGKVSDVLFSNFNGAPGNSDIATIVVHTLKPGKSQIRLSGTPINPFASHGEQLNVSYGKIEINTITN